MRKLLRPIVTVLGISLRADPIRALGYLVLSTGASLSGVLTPYFLKLLTDAALARDVEGVTRHAMAMGVVTALALLGAWTGIALLFTLIENTSRYVDVKLMGFSAGISGLEHHERPEYLDRTQLLRSGRGLLSSSSQVFMQSAELLLTAVGTGYLLGRVSPWLLALPLFGIPSLFAGVRSERHRQRVVDSTAEATRRARHLFELATTSAAGKEMRVFGLADELVTRHERDWRAIDRALDRAALRATALTAGGWSVFALGYGLALLLVVERAARGDATPGDVVMALALVARINQVVQGLVGLAAYFAEVFSVGSRYVWLADYARDAARRVTGSQPVPGRLADGIALDHVTFAYPGTDVEVLRDVTLLLPAGSTVALVGDNGAGKSTLVKLLCRFYEPTRGRITVDGVDLVELDLLEWRRRMAAGFQDFARFELLAREVVGVGDLPAIDDEPTVSGALERAGGADVVPTLAAGLETQLGRSFDGGSDLSGGQWQKLALGRAMMREHPLLLVLDEPTSALDAETEHALFERYAGAAKDVAARVGAVTLLVSHRFSTVRMADLIVVIDNNGVAECGTHEELISRHGIYAELYELQARAYR